MRIVFRTDASKDIGGGHVMRCLALAEKLKGPDSEIYFVCRQHPGNLCDLIEMAGHRATRLPAISALPRHGLSAHSSGSSIAEEEDASETLSALPENTSSDWIVVDHYALSAGWETVMRSVAKHIMVIDDLADRKHDCDLLLDQNLSACERIYRPLVPSDCTLLLGPSFALLRDEFVGADSRYASDLGGLRILINFGSSDPTGDTLRAIEVIKGCSRPDWRVEIVTGANCPDFQTIRQACDMEPGFRFHGQVKNMAVLMKSCDLAIGGGGVSALERCALGLPSIVVAVANNQIAACEALAAAEAIEYVGPYDSVSHADIRRSLLAIINDPLRRRTLAKNGQHLVDGNGSHRVAMEIEKGLHGVNE